MTDRLKRTVLGDDVLLVDVDARLESLVSRWVQLGPGSEDNQAQAAARVYVHEAPLLGVEVPATAPTLRLGSVGVWLRHDAGRAVLGAAERDCAGAVDLDVMQATIVIAASAEAAGRLEAMLTLSASLLLGRLGRALVHAAAMVSPAGGAWLLVGDEGAGKATTVRRLAATGWPWLSVERAVLRTNGHRGALRVEGWPGPASAFGVDDAPRSEPEELAGALVLRHAPDQETSLVARRDADLFSVLLPTSPWLRLDQAGAAGAMRALRTGVEVPVYDLHLGLDSYAHPERLAEVLEGLPAAPPH